ncbi:hypothetical protein QYE76_012291 [Lolium multiflorum]|uniref:Uncharacterized protein n=1 Tax=Lolium multiflorum TaxID=4521 RepID=A0AAD8U1K5_LOLMU|nr:hypothetical protein QYE76_012291 [Lolium multiflorum]
MRRSTGGHRPPPSQAPHLPAARALARGGGVALVYASNSLDKLEIANFDQKIGVQIIQNALKTPVYTIALDASVKGAVVVGKILEQDNTERLQAENFIWLARYWFTANFCIFDKDLSNESQEKRICMSMATMTKRIIFMHTHLMKCRFFTRGVNIQVVNVVIRFLQEC